MKRKYPLNPQTTLFDRHPHPLGWVRRGGDGFLQACERSSLAQADRVRFLGRSDLEILCDNKCHGTPRRHTAAKTDPIHFDQQINGAARHDDAANFLNLGTCHGLVIGDDGQCFDGRTGQFAGFNRFFCIKKPKSPAVRMAHASPTRVTHAASS